MRLGPSFERVRTATRRRYGAEEKIRIVLEGFRRETPVNDLCRREGIKPHSPIHGPRSSSQEVHRMIWAAREMPELSCQQSAAWTTDNLGFSVSESTVYRMLRREGLVKRSEMRLATGKEYHRRTTGPHQMWATDASYFRVVSQGYLPGSVMDDYSRFILAYRLHRDMTSDSLIEVVQDAADSNCLDNQEE